MNIKIITVNFGNSAPTELLIESISSCKKLHNISISIIDNCSSKESLQELNNLRTNSELNIDIFTNKKNLFYWPAAKKMIESLNNLKKSIPDWILICNNDITFMDKDFFKKLEKINLTKYPIIGPKIVNNNGKNLNPFMIKPFNFISKLYWRLYFISYPISILMLKFKKYIKLIFLNSKTQNTKHHKKQVYSVHGAAILFSSHFFKSGGWLDDNFELYGEELTVAEIAKIISIPIYYMPELTIKHNEHTNTKKINKRLLFKKARYSYHYINSKYFKK